MPNEYEFEFAEQDQTLSIFGKKLLDMYGTMMKEEKDQ